MKYLTSKQAQLARKISLILLKVLFAPVLIVFYSAMILMIPYLNLEDYIQSKLFWIMQGKSTDFNVRLRKCLDNAK